MSDLRLHTAAWHGDREVTLDFPPEWDVATHCPKTPAALSERDIAARLRAPVGQPALSELARGKWRPVVIVDDTTRPPTAAVLGCLLSELSAAGIAADDVTVILATGTHGRPPPGAAQKKLGAAFAACRVVRHDDRHGLVRVGATSFGTPCWSTPQSRPATL